MMKVIGAAALGAAMFVSVPAFAQFASTNGTGDAAAQNQRSTVGVGVGTGSGGYGYRYGWGQPSYVDPYYAGRSVYVAPAYGYAAPVVVVPAEPYSPY